MNHLKSKKMDSKGFTLVEIIVTIVAAGILGAIFVQLMGTALNSSWNAVEIVRDEAGGAGTMEEIIADYVDEINSDPGNALEQLVINNNDLKKYGENVTMRYIEFDTNGNEVDKGIVPTDNLKVVFQTSGQVLPAISGRYSMTTILTNSRADNDAFVLY